MNSLKTFSKNNGQGKSFQNSNITLVTKSEEKSQKKFFSTSISNKTQQKFLKEY